MSSKADLYSLSKYQTADENFMYGVSGVLRLPVAKDTIFNLMFAGMENYMPTSRVKYLDCILAVSDKRVLFIQLGSTYPFRPSKVFSFNFSDIYIKYKKMFSEKQFLIFSKNNKIFDFVETKIVFECHNRQDSSINKVRAVLKEFMCDNYSE